MRATMRKSGEWTVRYRRELYHDNITPKEEVVNDDGETIEPKITDIDSRHPPRGHSETYADWAALPNKIKNIVRAKTGLT